MYRNVQPRAHAEPQRPDVTEGVEKPHLAGREVSILLGLRHGKRSQESPADQHIQSVSNVRELIAKLVGVHLTDGRKSRQWVLASRCHGPIFTNPQCPRSQVTGTSTA